MRTTAPDEYIILVDENDQEIGVAEKLTAHKNNQLHRAFSVFIFRNNPQTGKQEILLQQRALGKYHSPGLWTNTCCSHPRAGEDIIKAGERRLYEELGIKAALHHAGSFQYHAYFPNGLHENEIDHVLIGKVSANMVVMPNPEEVHAYRWIGIDALHSELNTQAEQFTPWLQEALRLASADGVGIF